MPKKTVNNQPQQQAWIIAFLGLLAAMAYSTWPLGYYLNPRVGATGYASELAVIGQPYNWVFIAGDVIAGILIVGIVVLLWRRFKPQLRTWHKWILGMFGLFGLLTIIAALLPMSCTPSISLCPQATEDWETFLHNSISIAAGITMYLTAFMVWQRYDRDERMLAMHFILAAFTTFGILSFFYAFIPGPAYLSQRYFLIVSCAWIFLLPYYFIRSRILFEPLPSAK
jgi:hypothetical protein